MTLKENILNLFNGKTFVVNYESAYYQVDENLAEEIEEYYAEDFDEEIDEEELKDMIEDYIIDREDKFIPEYTIDIE